jgi:hypothetical protein
LCVLSELLLLFERRPRTLLLFIGTWDIVIGILGVGVYTRYPNVIE